MASERSSVVPRRLKGSFQPLHKSMAHFVPLFYVFQAAIAFICAQVPLFDVSASGLGEASGVIAAITCYTLPAMVAPRVVQGICRLSTRSAFRIAMVVVFHAMVFCSAYQAWLKISFNFVRFGMATLSLVFQLKLHEIVLYSFYYHGGADNEVRREQILRGKYICQAAPMERAGLVLLGLNFMDVDYVAPSSHVSHVIKPALLHLASIGAQFAFNALFFGILYHELGIQPPLFLLILFHMSCVYPTLSCIIIFVQLPMLFLSGGWNPRFRSGEQPFLSGSIREFWGRRYNLLVSDLCNRTIFKPLMLDMGCSPLLSSFFVFLFTGFLHAIPLGVLSASKPSQCFLQMFFFLSHWAVCVWESVYRPRPSVLRTWVLFVLLYPSFAISSIDALTHPDVGLSYLWSSDCWQRVRAAALLAR